MFEIRRAEVHDLPAARQILSLCPPAHRIVDEPATDPRAALYVAQAGNSLIGCVGFDVVADGHGLIRSLAVLPGFRKQNVGRHLMLRLLAHADEHAIPELVLLTDRAREYFVHLGFAGCDADCLPEPVRNAERFRSLHHSGTVLMRRATDGESCRQDSAPHCAAVEAKRHFDAGYYCSEAVLLSLGRELGVSSELLPAIATGFGAGVARSWGTCGAVNGAVLGLNLAFGRRRPDESVRPNFEAVRALIGEFGRSCGSTKCSELLGCDLDTTEGQRLYQTYRLRVQCREYVGLAARLATSIIRDRQGGGT